MGKQATKYKEMGNKEFKAGNHAKAIEYYTYATELDPNNPIFYTNRSTAYFKMKKFDKSLRDANKAIKKDATWAKGYYRRGLCHLESKDDKSALADFEKACKLKPDNQTFQNMLRKTKSALMDGMSEGEITKVEANELFKAGKFPEAIKKYTTAISLCDDSDDKEKMIKADCYANRAACHRQLYASAEVVKDCTKCLELNPRHVKAYIRRAQAHESLEKYKKALQDFESANQIQATSVSIQGAGRVRSALKKCS